jgi:hypothetical protein
MSFATGPAAIEEAYVRQFQEGFEHTYQQDESILDPLVDRDTQASEYKSWQRIGEAEEMVEDTTRYGDNPVSEIPHDNRRISLRHFETGKYVDPKDLLKVISDPTNDYNTALIKTGKRLRDDFLIEKYFADANTGKEGGTAVSYSRTPDDENDITIRVGALSAGSSNPITTAGRYTLTGANSEGISVGANFDRSTGTASGLTIAKMQGLRTAMLRVEAIQPEDVIPLLVTSYQIEELLVDETVINNMDTSTRRNLAEGNITVWGGFKFIISERLALSEGSDGDERRCMAFLPRALKLTIGEDLKGNIWKDPSKKNITYMHFKQSIGASRMWGEIAGEIRCLEV